MGELRRYIYVLLALIVVAVIVMAVRKDKKTTEFKTSVDDYTKIELVKTAVETLAKSDVVNTVGGSRGQWYIFDLRAVKDHSEDFYVQLVKILGDDFDSRLSTGDYLFAGVFPLKGSYRVYAGDPANNENMLYPDWNYTKLAKK